MTNELGKIVEGELLTRFVFDSAHYSSNGIKWRAFQPSNNQVSVFRIKDLDEMKIWDIGLNHVGLRKKKPPKCRIDFQVQLVKALDLNVEAETSTHERHANIVKWPDSDSARLMLAKKLAATVNKSSKPCRPTHPSIDSFSLPLPTE